MRERLLLLALSLACSTNPGVQLAPGNTQITPARVDSVIRRTESDWRDAPRRSANEAANVIAMSIDTLIVHPDSLELVTGRSIPLFGGPISWTARDHKGSPVSNFAPWFRVDNSRVLALRGDELIPVASGRASLLLTVAVRSDSQPPRILHVTRLRIVVP